jgi:predicted small lipoprotein YifL
MLAGMLIACLALAACGRRGPLEAPPGAIDTAAPPTTTGQPPGFAAAAGQATDGNPAPVPGVAPTEPERSFFLDFLL